MYSIAAQSCRIICTNFTPPKGFPLDEKRPKNPKLRYRVFIARAIKADTPYIQLGNESK